MMEPRKLICLIEMSSAHNDGFTVHSAGSGWSSSPPHSPCQYCRLTDDHYHRLAPTVTAHDDDGCQAGGFHNSFRPSDKVKQWRLFGDRSDLNGAVAAVTRSQRRPCQWQELAMRALWKTVLLCGISVLCACTMANNPPVAPDVSASAAAVGSSRGAYVLHPTDQVQVRVYNEPDISGEYHVDSAGYVSIPLAGRIKAEGLTVPALEREIASRLNRGLIKQPKVNVQIANYAPFYIHGEVKRGGEFSYRPGMTVLDAVASAGGFTYRADDGAAYVRAAGENGERVYALTSSVSVHPGDNIRIAERFF